MDKCLALLVALMLSACALVPEYERPELDLPESALASTLLSEAQREAMAYWWTRFRDPVLNRLIDSALDDNLDIALQFARVREARAQLGLETAQFYPTLSGQANAARQKVSGATSSGPGAGGGGSSLPGGGASREFDSFSVSASLNYELNLFAALNRQDAAEAQLLSSAYSADAIRLTVISDVVTNYMSLRATQRQIRVTQATIEARETALALAEQRYEYGAIDKLALLQQRALLASARARLPQLRRQAGELESALAILTGKTPREIATQADIDPGKLSDVHLPGELPVVLPSALVNRRPDIRAAEAALIAANAQVGVARSQYFPTFNLTAMIGSVAPSVGALFGAASATHSIAGVITAPILTFGRLGAQVDTAQAQRQQAEIMYRATVRRAFQEVRDALIGVRLTHERVQTVQRQVDAYADTLDLAQVRYDFGRTSLLAVLDAQRQLLDAQLTLAEAIRDRFVTTANLFKALGGGWTESSDSVPDEAETIMPSS